jgi:hypothetical protein
MSEPEEKTWAILLQRVTFFRSTTPHSLVFSIPTTSQRLPLFAILMASECATPFAFMETLASGRGRHGHFSHRPVAALFAQKMSHVVNERHP